MAEPVVCFHSRRRCSFCGIPAKAARPRCRCVCCGRFIRRDAKVKSHRVHQCPVCTHRGFVALRLAI